MTAIREHHVSSLAHRIGLRLVKPEAEADTRLFRLVEPLSMQPIYPAGETGGVELDELEDWLQFPWE
ncbi:hypothetical protein [uncultured Thiohalocapsa sp.]|uniref:hypothetical protein n=1 Tax=uncultured Thiohalocapsa sp. TaxID=768990 RepID=UPI0025CE8229|nr:hypothetical protein [uncultured Thiohalocapsa sp.]